jgi:hypothetical protein
LRAQRSRRVVLQLSLDVDAVENIDFSTSVPLATSIGEVCDR